jgi:C_GCAxxG_C_C family probable redox protein
MESAELKNLGDEAARLALEYARQYGGCAQVVLAAVKETLGGIGDDVFQSAAGMGGGLGHTGHACGALNGGTMVFSCFWGRPYDDFADSENRLARICAMSKRLVEKFQNEYDSADCYGIQRKIMGRSYDLGDPLEREQFVEDGGKDDKCPSVCANSVRWIVEILSEEGLI